MLDLSRNCIYLTLVFLPFCRKQLNTTNTWLIRRADILLKRLWRRAVETTVNHLIRLKGIFKNSCWSILGDNTEGGQLHFVEAKSSLLVVLYGLHLTLMVEENYLHIHKICIVLYCKKCLKSYFIDCRWKKDVLTQILYKIHRRKFWVWHNNMIDDKKVKSICVTLLLATRMNCIVINSSYSNCLHGREILEPLISVARVLIVRTFFGSLTEHERYRKSADSVLKIVVMVM